MPELERSEPLNHLVAFIDLLGFKETIRNEETFDNIYNLLQNFKREEGNYKEVSLPPQTEGEKRKLVRPAITTFSDNMVISQPINDKDISTGISILLHPISNFAFLAIKEGFLIRGGISTGKMHHENGIVLGDAMIKAYKLESTLAIYPRIIIDPQILKSWQLDREIPNVIADFDGMHILNYYNMMLSREPIQISNIISENIEKHKDNTSALTKWKVFESYFKKAKRKFSPGEC